MITIRFKQDFATFKSGQIIQTSDNGAKEVLVEKIAELMQHNEKAPVCSIEYGKWAKQVEIHKEMRNKVEIRPNIRLPQSEMDSAFVSRLAKNLADKKIELFYDPSTAKILEINEWHDVQKNRYVFGKRFVDALRLKAILEENFNFEIELMDKRGDFQFVRKSPSKALIEFTMNHNDFRDSLKKLNGVFESPFVYLIDNKLKIANTGYNEDCHVYIRKDAPQIKELDLEEAKKVISDCLIDFPFQAEQDKTVQIASLITPMLRGIYGQYGVRTPVFAYLGNQQGCGKDYCAGIRHIIYTGKFNEDAPLSNDKGSNSDEIQKEFVSFAINGQQFMHNSNCRGKIENASYEKQVTSTSIRGRALGTNVMIDAENIIENSFSGNYGVTFNRDIARRTIFVNLFTEVEDTTKRKFSKDLHQWIKDNRSLVLSAIYTLINNWYKLGCPEGDGVNASFPLWAKFCTGVMQASGYADPTVNSNILSFDIGGDTETRNICQFNKEMGEWLENTENLITDLAQEHAKKGVNKNEIFSLYEKIYSNQDDRPFGYFDLSTPKDRREFGRLLNKYLGTYRGGYKLIISEENEKRERQKFKFVKTGASGSSGAKLQPITYFNNLPNSTKPEKLPQLPQLTHFLEPVNPILLKLLSEGTIYEVRPGEYRKV